MSSNPLLLQFSTTPLDTLEGTHARLTQTFLSGKTRDMEFRKVQLRKLYYAILDNRAYIYAALKADLNKPDLEASMAEVSWLEKDIMTTLKNLDKWAADETAETDFMYKFMKPRITKNPMGTVLIIGPFNYPVQLVLVPLIGAISAGCTCVVKPSEMTPYSSAIIKRIVDQLDPECYAVVNGGVEETTKLLDLKWDKILYTGNGTVGRIVAKAASKHLTPVILELGGLNPVLITSKADAKLAAKRTAWGKVINCGQICLAPDYVLLDPSTETAFVESFIKTMNEFFPNGTQDRDNYARIINERHFDRIMGLLERTKGQVVFGGKSDRADKWIEPTLVKLESLDDSLLSEEIFGPLLPYYVVHGGLPEMIQHVRTLGDCPLALYAFTNDEKEKQLVMNSTRSGGVSFNDTIFHAAIQSIPFGGVGESGNGCYRGRSSFDAFTHRRPVITQPSWLEGMMGTRYPPYSEAKIKRYNAQLNIPSPDFDRSGNLLYNNWFWRVFLLGARKPKTALLRYILVALGVYLIKANL
ncbi:Aldehyde/histidinol dehydrogenase [Sphaerosporella brunnea]|uniref:Aldehyde dehydrogenase n=1 Tax=Sphaerosporella brunnea TaxID=1250544 RepID=A0A5J5EW92_9PEZI|nr:Aldehyde/histidinol dehydrogenase [Sphaerosporella brunnea]